MVQPEREFFSVVHGGRCTMRKPTQRTPSYCLHRASDQAVVRIDGKDHYLGKYDTPDSRVEYDRLIAEWLGNGRCMLSSSMAAGRSVDEIILAFWRHAERHYLAPKYHLFWAPLAGQLNPGRRAD
jgi:hypothetical protein